MKHYFIINPAAGKGQKSLEYIGKIKQYISAHNLDAEVYETKAFRDGQRFVESIAKKGEPVRFYACGGDGTLYEVVNGCYKYDNCEVACIPLGSGNDFVRLFGATQDLDEHVNGVPTKLDLIFTEDKVAINQCSMGLDAEICAKQASFKKLPLVTGSFAYDLSCLYCIAGKVKGEFKVTVDDKVYEDTFLFCYIGNSKWYGGGYKAGPLAEPDDGLLDVVMVKYEGSRAKLLPLIGKYKAGEHLDWDITTFVRGKKIKIESKKEAAVNVDGECKYVSHREFEIIPGGIKFVVPRSSEYLKTKSES